MKYITLYTGNGVSMSPVYADGRSESDYIRIVADDEKAITNGEIFTVSADIPKSDVHKWLDCDISMLTGALPDDGGYLCHN